MQHRHDIVLLAVLLCALFAITGCGASAEVPEFNEGEQAALDYLGQQLTEPAAHLMRIGEDVDDIYSDLSEPSRADNFPDKFDLRLRDVVTPVKSQNPFGTCWSFGTIAASESSLLSTLGLTAKEFAEQYGEEMDLSEKHLAYFTSMALPSLSDFPEGEYAYDASQAEEGVHILEGVDTSVYDMGGNYYLATSSLASGIGILKEKYAPYKNSEGTLDKEGDWSLPEDLRFGASYELKDANVLPSPAGRDADGNYIYRPEGTEAIKSELLKGRAVGISFLADQSRPVQTPEELRASMEKSLGDNTNITEEEKVAYIDARVGATDLESLSKEELERLVRLRCRLNEIDESLYDMDALKPDDLIRVFRSSYFTLPFDELVKMEDEEAGRVPYMSFIGEAPVTYAQYTYNVGNGNHAACIVGWDDTFQASSFREGYQPPADGVWIVKNSWGPDWGNDGYFYLSFYDMNIAGVQSYEYVNDAEWDKMDHFSILQYDYMPAEIISSTLFDAPVYAASVYEIDEDCALQYVSAMTGDLNTTVTASIYLLNDKAVSPTDGMMLESVTQTFAYAGYHRISLPTNLALPTGSTIAITILQRVSGANGERYALVNTSSLGEKAPEAYAKLHAAEGKKLMRYCVGVINSGENYVSFEEGRWIDWRNAVDTFASNGDCAYMAYDNLPIKGYVYPLEEVKQAHDLDIWVPSAGGIVTICPECGYVLESFD